MTSRSRRRRRRRPVARGDRLQRRRRRTTTTASAVDRDDDVPAGAAASHVDRRGRCTPTPTTAPPPTPPATASTAGRRAGTDAARHRRPRPASRVGDPQVELVDASPSSTQPVDLAWRAGRPDVVRRRAGRHRHRRRRRQRRRADDGARHHRPHRRRRRARPARARLRTRPATAPDVNYTDNNGDTVSPSSPSPPTARSIVDAERVLLHVDQPYPNHNGGDLAIRSRRHALHRRWATAARAAIPNAARSSVRHAARQDAAHRSRRRRATQPYTIPADNPFVGSWTASPVEIWSIGLRNPWRFTFDPVTARPVDRRRRPEPVRGDRRRRRADRRIRRRSGRQLRLERVRGQRPLQRRRQPTAAHRVPGLDLHARRRLLDHRRRACTAGRRSPTWRRLRVRRLLRRHGVGARPRRRPQPGARRRLAVGHGGRRRTRRRALRARAAGGIACDPADRAGQLTRSKRTVAAPASASTSRTRISSPGST